MVQKPKKIFKMIVGTSVAPAGVARGLTIAIPALSYVLRA
jgi:hypothetical protein